MRHQLNGLRHRVDAMTRCPTCGREDEDDVRRLTDAELDADIARLLAEIRTADPGYLRDAGPDREVTRERQ